MRRAAVAVFSIASLVAVVAASSHGGMPGTRGALGTPGTVAAFRAEGVVGLQSGTNGLQCSAGPHENCKDSRCCKDPGHTCFRKNEHWASCKDTCTPGISLHDPEEHRTPWSCEVTGLKGTGICSSATEDCKDTGCCKNPGYTCYEKNEHFSNCNVSCRVGVSPHDPPQHQTPWTCARRGQTTDCTWKPGNPDPARCTMHHSTYPTLISCLADKTAIAPYGPAKMVTSCDCDTGCQGPQPSSCQTCGQRDGKPCYVAQTWYCCDDKDFLALCD